MRALTLKEVENILKHKEVKYSNIDQADKAKALQSAF
jgi:hypothetical protein